MQANPVDTFLQEADDALAEIEATALSLSGDSSGGDAVNQIFRAFHTIKGSGSMFGFDDVAAGRCEPGAGIGIRHLARPVYVTGSTSISRCLSKLIFRVAAGPSTVPKSWSFS